LSDEPLNLDSLASLCTERSEQMVQQILARCADELAHRKRLEEFTIFDGLLAWTRPALALAATLVLLSLGVLARQSRASNTLPLFHAASLPPAAESWLLEGASPLAGDVPVFMAAR
jgi:hypothetical protein